MESVCSMDGERLSRLLDGELSPLDILDTEAHIAVCSECRTRLAQFRVADRLLARVRASRHPSARGVAALSLAAAFVASLATNAILGPGATAAPAKRSAAPLSPIPLATSLAPSETLSSFYDKVAPAAAARPISR